MSSHLDTRVAALCFRKPGVFPLLGDSGLELKRDNPHSGFASFSVLENFLFEAESSMF
jgi:hypothetical protein